ncbi:lytic transglycosylase domain-containing protein [Sphingobium sp. B11D3A]|uniref:lytic transglycosylase domain-containing protein n=1 Tax=Sphingobium sp. B11D3A TaxID=2940574 RepID=UPI0022244CDA|nr:lytic transglycosylase domain-containing protein [Sphingobium sp. B11D3A]
MRGTKSSLTQQFAIPVGPTSCAAPTYRKSALLSAAAEKRRESIYPVVHDIACRSGLPVGLMDALIIQESGYNHAAISKKGAFGLGQLMPDTARQLGVNRFDLRDNLRGAAAYLKQQLDSFGQVHLALAAYNAGPGRVRKKREIPNIEETQNYVRRILSNWYHLTDTANDSTSRSFGTRAQIVRVY